ncbi:MAG TPA: 4-oxalocrotonate tautomerase family protein [Candidatus Acidoferrales bacterium]|nr:4-oxalocrotonate tautomerase family protein [Candidatus Acidoferrales bacterium]
MADVWFAREPIVNRNFTVTIELLTGSRKFIRGRKNNMPLIHVKLIENVVPPAKRQELIARITDAVVSVGGEGIRSHTWVLLEDIKSGDWGIAGKAFTTDDARALGRGVVSG